MRLKGVWISIDIWHREGLSPTAKFLISYLIGRKKNNGTLNYTNLAKILGCTKARVSQVIEELEKSDLIRIKEDGKTRLYSLVGMDAMDIPSIFDGLIDDLPEDKRELLEIWIEYRDEIKRPIKTRRSAKVLVSMFEDHGLESLKKALNRSTANGWTGIFPEDEKPSETKVVVTPSKYREL